MNFSSVSWRTKIRAISKDPRITMGKRTAIALILSLMFHEVTALPRPPAFSAGTPAQPIFQEGPSAGILMENTAGFAVTEKQVLHHSIFVDLDPARTFQRMADDGNMPEDVRAKFNRSVTHAQKTVKLILRQLEKTFIAPPPSGGGRQKRFIEFLIAAIVMAVIGTVVSTTVSSVNSVSVSTLNSRMLEMEDAMEDIETRLEQNTRNIKGLTDTINQTVITVNSHSVLIAKSINLHRKYQEEKDFEIRYNEPWRYAVETLIREVQNTVDSLNVGKIPLYLVSVDTVKNVLSQVQVEEVLEVQIKMALEMGTALPMFVSVERMRIGFLLNLPYIRPSNVYQLKKIHNVGTWLHNSRWMVRTPDLVAHQSWEEGPMLVPDLTQCDVFKEINYICTGKPFLPNATQLLCGVLTLNHGPECLTIISQPPPEEQTVAVLVGAKWLVSSPVHEATISYPQHGTHTQIKYPYPVSMVTVPKDSIVTIGGRVLFYVGEELDQQEIELIDTFKGASIPMDEDLRFLLDHKPNHTLHLNINQGKVVIKDKLFSKKDRGLIDQHSWFSPQNILQFVLKVVLFLWMVAMAMQLAINGRKIKKLQKQCELPDYGVIPSRLSSGQV